MKKRIALIGLLLVLALFTVGNANARVLAAGDNSPALAPGDPIGPTGTITSNVPRYQWYSVSGATKYRIKVKKGFFKTVYDFKVSPGAAGCGATCLYFRAGILSNKNYKWKVRAKVGGNWQSWSAWEDFTVNASGGFKSSFKNNANGWTKLNGNWKIAKGKYVTKGQQGFYATSEHSGNYANFTYEVRMRRVWKQGEGCPLGWPASLYLRGTPQPLNGLKEWYQQMRYSYMSPGSYQISEDVNGVYNYIDGGSTGSIEQGWNTLLVVAKGSWYWFYINGTYIGATTDNSHSNGVVGVGFLQGNGCNDKFKVDWAKLSTDTPW